MRVLLVTPPYHAGVVESAGTWPHVGFIYIAGEVRRAGHEVAIYDAMSEFHTIEEIRQRLRDYCPDFVGVSAKTPALYAAVEVAKAAKEEIPRVFTALGGIHPTFCFREVLSAYPEVDFVVRGEGEQTLPELLAALEEKAYDPAAKLSSVRGIAYRENGEIAVTPTRPFIHNLDSLVPAWDLVNWADYKLHFVEGSRVATVSSSRGCSNECGFCSQQKFWQRTHRCRRPAPFLAEMEHLHEWYGVNYVMLTDEYPTRDRARWEAILDGLIERKLPVKLLIETCVADILRDADLMEKYREAGVWHIYVGVEGTNQERLDLFKKNIQCEHSRRAIELINGADIISETSFILGVPEETPESIASTLDLAKHYAPHYAHFLMLAPWPFADMYERLRPYIEEEDLSHYNLVEPVIKPMDMSREELMAAAVDCYRRFYMWQLPRWHTMPDGFKREYLLGSMEAMLKLSFLKKHGHGLGEMPAEVASLLRGTPSGAVALS
ncbi:MAG: cobalamin-dependent protein [Bacteroidetes bacterium]|nr:cobalamin-dependent protein [Bacteroidota bacterium]